jgi:stage III sporulation protein AG
VGKKNSIFDLFNKVKTNKKLQYFCIIILVVLSIFILFFSYKNNNEKNVQTDAITTYVTSIENKLANALSKVAGAGRVEVVITVESGMETVLAMKTTEKQTANGVEIETTPLIVNGKTVVIKENFPKIVGVLIVAEGAEKISVMNKIQQATISLLDININQIQILSMN